MDPVTANQAAIVSLITLGLVIPLMIGLIYMTWVYYKKQSQLEILLGALATNANEAFNLLQLAHAFHIGKNISAKFELVQKLKQFDFGAVEQIRESLKQA